MTQQGKKPSRVGLARIALSPRRWAWFVLGSTALVLGTLGVVLPVLPTTPFVILAALAFGKSSPAVEAWLCRNRTFGPILADWRAHGAIAPRYKAMAVTMMAATILASVALSAAGIVIAVQAVCMTGAAGYILTRPNGAL